MDEEITNTSDSYNMALDKYLDEESRKARESNSAPP